MIINLIVIETSPNTAHVWGLFKQNISLSQLMDSSRVMCFASKRLGHREVSFYSEQNGKHEDMIKIAWEILDKSDVIVHYNGKRFDIPTLNKEFLKYGMKPPSPYKEVDLLLVAREKFRFPSNKLDYVAKFLGVRGKVKHTGHELWVRCMAGDNNAWALMERYNKHDVRLLENVYKALLPWITKHPNIALYRGTGRPTCTNCGCEKVQSRGVQHTTTMTYRRYQCSKCGTWMRGRFNVNSKNAGDNSVMRQI